MGYKYNNYGLVIAALDLQVGIESGLEITVQQAES